MIEIVILPDEKVKPIKPKTQEDIFNCVRAIHFNLIPWDFVKKHLDEMFFLNLINDTLQPVKSKIEKPVSLFQFRYPLINKDKKKITEIADKYGFITVEVETFSYNQFGILIPVETGFNKVNQFFTDIELINKVKLPERDKLKEIKL